MPEFLLEVGCEEIPASWLPGLTEQLKERFTEIAAREHVPASRGEAHSTPRRLVLAAELPERQPDRTETVWGPSLKVAKDVAGNWTKAAEGFARKQGVTAADLQEGAKDPAVPSERYLRFERETPGRPAREVLPEVVAATLRSLAFPKRMSWDAWLDDGKGAFPFGRPIRWLIVLFAGEVVPFAIHALRSGAGGEVAVQAGDVSFGHRFLPRGGAGGPLHVRSLGDLKAALAEHCVLLDVAERRRRIEGGLRDRAQGARVDDHGLAAEWPHLAEHPTVLAGGIPTEFRSLPREVLETVLVHHQKYVPLVSGDTVERFAAVVDGDGANGAAIVRGMERVVVARLRDAAFFFAEDRKRSLESRVPDLAGVTFHRGLGTYEDKAARIVRLVEAMAEAGLVGAEDGDAARRAARLAKADLTTLMVREFPELQGVMGALYLEAEGGHAPAVVQAVRWHHYPTSVEEDAPPSAALSGAERRVFAAVSLADKLDSLAGYFGLGLVPSGSSDPFGLRRAAQGVVRLMLDFRDDSGVRPGLRDLAEAAARGHASLPRPATEVAGELAAFLLDRLRHVLGARGYPADEVEAALGAREPDALEDPRETLLRARALHKVRQEAREDFEHLAVAFKRAKNILEGAAPGPVDPALLREAAERELHAAVSAQQEAAGGYEARLRSLARLRAPVDRFFDDVLVMAEDERLRANRLGLLSATLAPFYRIADLSKLAG